MTQPSAERILREARRLPVADRGAYLDEACADDSVLRAEVERYLRSDAETQTLRVIPDTSEATVASPSGSMGSAAGAMARAVEPTIPQEHAGQTIGRYHLLEIVGEGGFGSVWAAEQREPVKRRVALKIIKLGMDTKQVIARFEAERQALAMMDHPNIAKVLDAGSTDTGRPYFVMELVQGVSIVEYCDTHKLDTTARLDLFMTVCEAIQHAHQKGIIHRDIKPSNVLVAFQDGKPAPKVIDFGIAKATNAELTQRTLFTEHQQVIGTPAYMSPEQAGMSALDIDTRSDVYSLGVLLYELLTGTTPFDTRSLLESGLAHVLKIIREEEPSKPSTRLSTLGETGLRTAELRRSDVKKLGLVLRGDLDWIVMKCLEKDRTRRYESASGLAADIERHLHDEPVAAGRPSTGYRLRKFVRRNRGQVIAVGVVAAALLLGIVGTTVGMLRALEQKQRAELAERDAQRELRRATEVKGLITDMLSSVSPEEAQGADVTLLKGILVDTASRLARGEVEDELIEAELRHVIGGLYRDLGLHDDAALHTPVAMEMRGRLLGDEHPDTLESVNSMASLLLAQGKTAEAEPLYRQTFEVRKRVLGDEHPDTLASMHNVAHIHGIQGRYDEADSLYLAAIEIMNRVLGEEHPDTLSTMLALAVVYADQGRYDEAETLYARTLERHRRVFGEEHSATIRTTAGLAGLYWRQGRYDEAEALFAEALAVQERVLGEEHPGTLKTMTSLALVHWSQGRFAEAEPLYLKTLEVTSRVLGEEHPDTLKAMTNLALVYQRQGRFDEAERLNLKTLEIQTRTLGEEDPSTLKSMGNLANLYSRQGRVDEAEPLHLKGLAIRRRLLGDEHPDTLGTMTNLAIGYISIQRFDDARAMLETSLPIKRRVLGMQHPWTSYAMEALAAAYDGLGRPDDALPLHRELLDLQLVAASEPDADASTLNGAARRLLAHDVEALRDSERALKLAERACAREKAAAGADLWMYLDTLALAQHMTGDTARAVETERRVIALLPDGVDASTRGECERKLREYEAALAGESAGDGGGDDGADGERR